jgi:hypothetical protein
MEAKLEVAGVTQKHINNQRSLEDLMTVPAVAKL